MATVEVLVAAEDNFNGNGRGSGGATDATVDTAFVGKHLSSTKIIVTEGRIDEYIERTGDNHPWYTGESAFGGPVAPAHLFPSHSSGGGWFLPNSA